MSSGSSRGWLARRLCASAALILGAPFIGQLRTCVRDVGWATFPAADGRVVIGAAAGATAASRFARHPATPGCARYRRSGRCRADCALATRRVPRPAIAEVDAVERFHFIEYGLITVLFYRPGVRPATARCWSCRCSPAFIVGHARGMAAVVHPGARRRSARRAAQPVRDRDAACCSALASIRPPALSSTLQPASRRRVAFAGRRRARRVRRVLPLGASRLRNRRSPTPASFARVTRAAELARHRPSSGPTGGSRTRR